MATSGQGNWCVYVRLEKAPEIKVYFESEELAIEANRELISAIEAVRAGRATIASFNGGRQSVDAKRYVSSEVLTAERVPGGSGAIVM